MPAKVVIRRKAATYHHVQKGHRLDITTDSQAAIFQLEKMIKDQFNEFWKYHMEDLEDLAMCIQEDAQDLAPVYAGTDYEVYEYDPIERQWFPSGETRTWWDPNVVPGALQDSIKVYVSRSRRYPGIIASASAHNIGKKFDYALIQEENVDFEHKQGEAHYLSQPFYGYVTNFLYENDVDFETPEGLADYGLEEEW